MTAQLVAGILAENDGSGSLLLLALGPAGGAALYWGLWSRYRNTGKSHHFESETHVVAQPITGTDRKIDEIKGTKKSGIDGDNRTNHRQRVQRLPDV